MLVNARNAAASYIPAIQSLVPNQLNYAPTPAKYIYSYIALDNIG